jgi:predicted DsbA family dithiol-disulfide isomerase
MTKPMKIDFVSDISCPWCVIGLYGLEEALGRVGDVVAADIHFQPFELNPAVPAGGQNLAEHIAEKYGTTEPSTVRREAIRERAGSLGFDMKMGDDHRIYNTFDAHRLLYWAGLSGGQSALKHALFETYFTHGRSVGDHAVLIEAAVNAGLDREAAREVLESGRYGDEVRAAEQLWRSRGISSVPAIVINDRYLISGGQPPEAFEKALREIATEA